MFFFFFLASNRHIRMISPTSFPRVLGEGSRMKFVALFPPGRGGGCFPSDKKKMQEIRPGAYGVSVGFLLPFFFRRRSPVFHLMDPLIQRVLGRDPPEGGGEGGDGPKSSSRTVVHSQTRYRLRGFPPPRARVWSRSGLVQVHLPEEGSHSCATTTLFSAVGRGDASRSPLLLASGL